MPQPGLTYTVDDLQVKRRIRKLLGNLNDLEPVMENIGEMGVRSIQENFKQGGRPGKWKGLKAATIKQRIKVSKWPGEILVRSGELKKISHQASKRDVVLSPADVDYDAIHHFGKPGKMPARPYMLLQKEDETEIVAMLADYAMQEN